MGECASSRDEKDELKCERARAQRRMMIDRLSRGLEFDFSFRRREEPYTTSSFLHFFLRVRFFFFFTSSFPIFRFSALEKVDVEFSDRARDPILSVSDPGDFPDAHTRSRLKGVIERGRALSTERIISAVSIFRLMRSERRGRFLDETRLIHVPRVGFLGVLPSAGRIPTIKSPPHFYLKFCLNLNHVTAAFDAVVLSERSSRNEIARRGSRLRV